MMMATYIVERYHSMNVIQFPCPYTSGASTIDTFFAREQSERRKSSKRIISMALQFVFQSGMILFESASQLPGSDATNCISYRTSIPSKCQMVAIEYEKA